jgi:hypothetical protein
MVMMLLDRAAEGLFPSLFPPLLGSADSLLHLRRHRRLRALKMMLDTGSRRPMQ